MQGLSNELPVILYADLVFVIHYVYFPKDILIMRKILTWAVLVILTVVISCSTQKQADLIIFNGTIYTVDDAFSKVEALAISEGKIMATGSNEDIRSAFAAGEEINLEGKFVYPGLIDPHCHFIGYGNSLMHADLSATSSFEEVIEVLLEQQEKYPTEWVQGWGWDHEDWPVKEFPHRDQLDRVFPDIPVFLTRADGHSAIVNSKALQLSGVIETSRIEGGSLLQKNGKLTGMLIDNAMGLIREQIPRPTREEVIQMIQMSQVSCFKVGLTSVHDAGLDFQTIDLIDSLQKADLLKMRIYAMLTPGKENYERYLFHGPYQTDRLNVRSIKLFSDGALSSRGALMLEEYFDDPGNIGLALNTEEYLRENMKLAYENGFQVNTHCIGDSANRWILDMYGDYLKGKNDRRWRIEHVQILSPDDLHKFGDFSIIPSIQSTASTTDMHYAENRVGPIRVKSAYAYRELMKQNGWIPNGSDFPVESNNPLYGYYALVTRKDLSGYPDNGWQMENALNRKEALCAMTIWAARAAFEENEKGSLEAGKMADFIILGEDLMTVTESKLPHLKVQGTYLAGEQVYPELDE